jgi:hypothetical protein
LFDAVAELADGAEAAEGGAFLPADEVADVVADEVDGAVGLEEGFVAGVGEGSVAGVAEGEGVGGFELGLVGAVGAEPRAFVVRDLAPADVDGLLELVTVAGVEALDGGAGGFEFLLE